MNVDWKWLLVGIAFALFALPMLLNMLRGVKRKTAPAA